MSSPEKSGESRKNQRMPGLYRNLISLIALVVIFTSLICIAFLVAIDLLGNREHPYLGIFAYMLFPTILFSASYFSLSGC
ncbi:MAG: hypothetical protein IPJ07_24820 [Acidobacteria bacterium]|nr:hypothetical protein [Acidobacteriota bacterium]